jgi:hypothetical protein
MIKIQNISTFYSSVILICRLILTDFFSIELLNYFQSKLTLQ